MAAAPRAHRSRPRRAVAAADRRGHGRGGWAWGESTARGGDRPRKLHRYPRRGRRARGLALATGRPALGVRRSRRKPPAATLRARWWPSCAGRGQTLFAQRFDAGGAASGEPVQLSARRPGLLCREGDEILGAARPRIDGLAVARPHLRRLAARRGPRCPALAACPLYLRAPDARRWRAGRRSSTAAR